MSLSNKKTNHKKGLRLRFQTLSVLSMIGLILGQLGQLYWLLDLFSHFAWCYSIGFFLGIFAFRRKIMKVIMGSLLLIMIFWSFPNILFEQTQPKLSNFPTQFIQLASYNLKFDSFASSDIRAMKLMEGVALQPSMVFLSEYGSDFDNFFKAKHLNSYRCGKVEDSPFGIALYSNLNNLICTIEYPDEAKFFPYIRAENEHFVVYGIHPPPPINGEMAGFRDHTFKVIATKVKTETKPVVVMGDMNISPYSPIFRQFTKEAGLFETKNRLIPTWLMGLLNIDHILVTQPSFEDSRVGWWRGSDHRPVFLDI